MNEEGEEDEDDDVETASEDTSATDEGDVKNNWTTRREILREEDEEGKEAMWQDIAVGNGAPDDVSNERGEEEDVGDMPIAAMEMDDEGDVISEREVFADELGIVDEGHHGPNILDLAAGFANALVDKPFGTGPGSAVDGNSIVWTGAVRSTRRRGAGDDDLEIPAPSAEECNTSPYFSTHLATNAALSLWAGEAKMLHGKYHS